VIVNESVTELPLAREGGDQAAAFTRLAEANLDASYRLARAILHDPVEAEDATHDAYLQAWRKWSTLHDATRFEAWFARILVNTCRDRLRRTARRRPADISALLTVAAEGDPFGQAHDRDALGAALARLTPDHRVVLALRFYQDQTIDQIASHLGLRRGTVNSRLHYALKELRGHLDAIERRGLQP
jgi:RNA polymerase sigma-70 factor, ECF subfamily